MKNTLNESTPSGAAAAAESVDTEKVPPKRIAAVITALVLSALIMILNETVLTVALPNLMADLAIVATTAQWLTTGFMLTMAVVIPTTGFMLQRFTTRRLFVWALLLFILGTALAAAAPSFAVLLAGRIVQAGGTAIILPLLMTTTLTSVPIRHRGTVMGLNSVVISVAPAVGPTLSGAIVDSLSWRWVFGLMVPVDLIVFLFGVFAIKTGGETRKAPLDVPSVVLSAVAFGGIVYALSSIADLLDGAWSPVVALLAGATALVLFVSRQRALRKTGSDLLDLRPFKVHNFRVSVVIVMIAMATMLGTVMVMPIFMQNGMGLDTLTIGLALLPGGLIQGVISPIVGRVYDQVGPRPIVIPGAILLSGGQWLLGSIHADSPIGLIIAFHTLFCVGMAMLMTPLMTVALGSLPRGHYGHGSAIMNTLQQLAGAAGTAILIAAMTIGTNMAAASGIAGNVALVDGVRAAFTVGGVLGLVAVVCAPGVRRMQDSTDQ